MSTGRSATKTRVAVSLLLTNLLLGLAVLAWHPVQADDLPGGAVPGAVSAAEPAQDTPSPIYLPAVFRYYPWTSPFGVESSASLTSTVLMDRAVDLRVNWIRLNGRISWRKLQPTEGAAIDWTQLADFEDELRALKGAGMTPIVIVDDHPEWATIEAYGGDGERSWCAAILPEKYEAFAQFVRALVARYKGPEFDVHYWELGNEPDVDPCLVSGASVFGCWGDIDDAYYGGESYGEMLKVVTPAIQAEDPLARVMVGGLLLDRPETTDPNAGRPELFLEGILRAGGGGFFDILAFHAYPSYWEAKIDYDLNQGVWTAGGGMVMGKAAYLRQVMARYGVQKPLFLNETALGCHPSSPACNPPDLQFFDVQASHVARMIVRGLGQGIMGFTWYTLNGPGWRYTGLLEADGTPKPAYHAYATLTAQLGRARYVQPVDYGPGLEAYAFRRGSESVQIVWARDDQVWPVSVPASTYVAAFDRDGGPVTPTLVDASYQFQVGFEPVYLILDE